ncbi:MAG: hypothetical protein WCG10_07905 [Chlamydiota bacterium]
MALTLSVFLSKYCWPMALLAIIACVSLPLVWKLKLKGACYSICLILIAFLWMYSFSQITYSMFWIFCFCLSLGSSLFVAALCFKESQIEDQECKEQEEKKWIELQESYTVKQSLLEKEIKQVVDQSNLLQQKVIHYEKDQVVFEKLMGACQEEADKYFIRGELLSTNLIEMQAQLAKFEENVFYEKQYEKKNTELLNKLNEARVECYQYKMMATQKPAEVIAPQGTLTAYEQEQYEKKLETLESERFELQRIYQEHFRDHQALSHKMQTVCSLSYLSQGQEDLDATYDQLKGAFEIKARELQHSRIEIFKIEGAILQVKKVLKVVSQDAEFSPGSYLAIADQECLRLEEENSMLLELVMQILPVSTQKAERP